VELRVDDGRQVFGVGMDHDIISAAIRAVTSGVLRAARMQSAGAAQEAVA
jgi:2-isopropylmalate synthase